MASKKIPKSRIIQHFLSLPEEQQRSMLEGDALAAQVEKIKSHSAFQKMMKTVSQENSPMPSFVAATACMKYIIRLPVLLRRKGISAPPPKSIRNP